MRGPTRLKRAKALIKNPSLALQAVRPLAGIISANFPRITDAEYIALVVWTARQLHLGKRGTIAMAEPPALRQLGLDAEHWTMTKKRVAHRKPNVDLRLPWHGTEKTADTSSIAIRRVIQGLLAIPTAVLIQG